MADKPTIEDAVSATETWQVRRHEIAQGFHLRGLREFCEFQNFQTRKLISYFGKQDPEFWTALAELATNAQTLTTKGAKVFADKKDVTNL